MEPRKYDAVVVGLNVVDILFELPGHVVEGEKHEVQRLLIQGGAPAGNAACGLASMGWKTGFIGKLGDNLLSTISREELRKHDVCTDLLMETTGAQPAVAVVAIDPSDGERTVYYSLNGYEMLTKTDIPADTVKNARLVLVDGYETEGALETLRIAKEHGIRSVLDIETGDRDLMREAMRLGSDTILPLNGARKLTGCATPGDALRELASWTDGLVLITDGTNGSWAHDAGTILHQPMIGGTAVDTTGCGDAYHAGYASALLDDLPLKMRMEFAALFAAQVAMQFGGRTNLPTRTSLKNEDLSEISPELREYILKQGALPCRS